MPAAKSNHANKDAALAPAPASIVMARAQIYKAIKIIVVAVETFVLKANFVQMLVASRPVPKEPPPFATVGAWIHKTTFTIVVDVVKLARTDKSAFKENANVPLDKRIAMANASKSNPTEPTVASAKGLVKQGNSVRVEDA